MHWNVELEFVFVVSFFGLWIVVLFFCFIHPLIIFKRDCFYVCKIGVLL